MSGRKVASWISDLSFPLPKTLPPLPCTFSRPGNVEKELCLQCGNDGIRCIWWGWVWLENKFLYDLLKSCSNMWWLDAVSFLILMALFVCDDISTDLPLSEFEVSIPLSVWLLVQSSWRSSHLLLGVIVFLCFLRGCVDRKTTLGCIIKSHSMHHTSEHKYLNKRLYRDAPISGWAVHSAYY